MNKILQNLWENKECGKNQKVMTIYELTRIEMFQKIIYHSFGEVLSEVKIIYEKEIG